MAANRWRFYVLSVAREHKGLDRMILASAAKHVLSEEGMRVAMGALGYEVDAETAESIRERIAVEERAVMAALKGGSS